MANIIPWGSKTTEAFFKGLGGANRPLLARALEFADDLNSEIVEILRPRLVVVPLSLARSRSLDAVRETGLSLLQAEGIERHSVKLPERSFSCYTGSCRRGKLTVRTLFFAIQHLTADSRCSRKNATSGISMRRTCAQT
jgi:hypothetical protein